MAFVHGKYAKVFMTDSAGTSQDISAYVNEVDLPVSLDTAETSHFGSQSKTYILGLDDGTISIKGMYDPALDAIISGAIDAIKAGTNTAITVIVAPAGTATGSPKFTLSGIPTAYEVDSPVSGVETFSFALQRSGSTTRSVY